MSSSHHLDGGSPSLNGGNDRNGTETKTNEVRGDHPNNRNNNNNYEETTNQHPTTTAISLGMAIPTTIAHNIHPNNLIVAPDGAIYAMIKPPDNYQGGPIPHYRNLNFGGHYNSSAVASSHLSTDMIPGPTTGTTTTTNATTTVLSTTTHYTTPSSILETTSATSGVTMDGGFVKRNQSQLGNDNLHMIYNDNNTKRIKTYSSPSPTTDPQEEKLQQSSDRSNATTNATNAMTFLSSPMAANVVVTTTTTTTGRSYLLYTESDERNLSQYQCMARKQIEIFEATPDDANINAQGRNRPVLVGQVGIRCKHCAKTTTKTTTTTGTTTTGAVATTTTTNNPKSVPRTKQRKTGSIYFPNRVSSGVM
jgi:hypothetical protein